MKLKKPKLTDFYDVHDPRGCSTSEYGKYMNAVDEYNKKYRKQNKNASKKKLYQCPHSKAVMCSMTEPCLGCEDFKPTEQ